ncbi:MAG: hypothetical protein HY707_03805, partial [Ignavibacteriae bacterium]|nr:hypothetical protein [Ignavibacteriota bacterium]
MRLLSLVLSILLLCSIMVGQKRFLVSPNNEVIPLTKEQSAALEVQKRVTQTTASSAVCTDKFTFGYTTDNYPPNVNFGAMHKDVMGEWFVAPAAGTIDTVFWFSLGSVGALDSLLYVRIHNSAIGPDSGPGVRPGPFNPPCANWGYWVNTNDLDQGVAAFPEEATDSNWVSTYLPSTATSFPPFHNEIWGLGGFPVVQRPNQVRFARMLDLGYSPTVSIGQKFFISQRVNGPPTHVDDSRTEWATLGYTAANTADPNYPSRNWKFYEHDKGPSNCAGFPLDSIKRGWVARGGFGSDTFSVAVFNYWYAMTVTTNVPPIISNTLNLSNTFSTDTRTITVDIEDCNPENPATAGVQSAVIKWSTNAPCSEPVEQPDITLSPLADLTWIGDIPGQPVGTVVNYHVVTTDSQKLESFGPTFSYKVVALRNQYYIADTGYTCVKKDISGTGTALDDTSAWFEPMYTGSGTAAGDDGTAGPFDIGGLFDFGGSLVRYAWIGVNGAIALTASATDTQDVNSNGFATGGWDFPNCGQHNGRSDTAGRFDVPSNFIAGFWADHILFQDSPFVQCGRILYGNGGDTCQFVVEWDSIGAFDPDGPVCDETTFRIILNRCDGSIEVQYNSVGTFGLDSAALVGLEVDSASGGGWIYVNKDYEPYDTKPRNDWCIQFYPT